MSVTSANGVHQCHVGYCQATHEKLRTAVLATLHVLHSLPSASETVAWVKLLLLNLSCINTMLSLLLWNHIWAPAQYFENVLEFTSKSKDFEKLERLQSWSPQSSSWRPLKWLHKCRKKRKSYFKLGQLDLQSCRHSDILYRRKQITAWRIDQFQGYDNLHVSITHF